MPQTAIVQKTNASLHCLTKCRGEASSKHCTDRSLVQCVQRKLQYSQVPVRCQRRAYHRLAKSPFKLPETIATASRIKVKTTKSCPDNSECTPTSCTSRYKKSLSMIDLAPASTDTKISDLRSDSSSTLARLEEVGERTTEVPGDGAVSGSEVIGVRMWINRLEEKGLNMQLPDINKAAGLVCHVLVVNAWRRRREEIAHLQETIEQLGQQVDHLHIQIVVLRRLLDTENSRVGRLTNETHRFKMQLDDTSRERDAMKMEKEKVESEAKQLKEASEERTLMAENLRNELLSAQTQLQSLDAQIARDREKLLKLREDKKILLDKVTASENLASERGVRAERAESAAEDLQVRLAAQIALASSSQDQAQRCFKELKSKDEERLRLEKKLRTTEETGRALSLRVANLESQLSDRQAALRRLETAYNSQLTELNDLRERLTRQSQEVGWSSRVLQIAGSVVRAPRAILRTLSFLSNSGTPLPS